jgi:hypothetical protein
MVAPLLTWAHKPLERADEMRAKLDVEKDGHAPFRSRAIAFWRRCRQLLPASSPTLLWGNDTSECTLAALGSVEIRQTPAGYLAETCVKGELTPALATALQRLSKYAGGDNGRGDSVAVQRPLMLRRKAPALWQFSVRLADIDGVHAAPMPRMGKVRVVRQETLTYAAAVWPGRPTERAIQQAGTAIMDAIARSRWFACGSPVARMYKRSAIIPFMRSFEVAVPISAQGLAAEDCTLA